MGMSRDDISPVSDLNRIVARGGFISHEMVGQELIYLGLQNKQVRLPGKFSPVVQGQLTPTSGGWLWQPSETARNDAERRYRGLAGEQDADIVIKKKFTEAKELRQRKWDEPETSYVARPTRLDNVNVISHEPNILDDYDLPTYRVKLFVLPRLLEIRGKTVDSIGEILRTGKFDKGKLTIPEIEILENDLADRLIVASSGHNDIFTIDDLVINSVVNPESAGKSTATTGSFKLSASFGHDLFYYMSEASHRLGMQNWAILPLFLEIDFMGRDPETQNEQIIEDSRRIFPILITGMQTSVEEGLTIHDVDFIRFSDSATLPIYDKVKSEITIKFSDTDTVQAIANRFTDALLKNEIDAAFRAVVDELGVTNQLIAGHFHDIHEIVFDDQMLNSKLKFEEGEAYTRIKSENITLWSIGQGRAIKDIIIDLCMALEYFQEEYKRSIRESNWGDSEDEEKITESEVTDWFQIDTEIELLAYDSERNDYAKKYTWIVTPRPILTTGPISNDKLITSIVGHRMINKVYDYMYTGKNDQIMDLTFQFNNLIFLYDHSLAAKSTTGWYTSVTKTNILNTELLRLNDPTNTVSVNRDDVAMRLARTTQIERIFKAAEAGTIDPRYASAFLRQELTYEDEREFLKWKETGEGIGIMSEGAKTAKLIKDKIAKIDEHKAQWISEAASDRTYDSATKGSRLLVDVVQDDEQRNLPHERNNFGRPSRSFSAYVADSTKGALPHPSAESRGMATVFANGGAPGTMEINMTISGDLNWLPTNLTPSVRESDILEGLLKIYSRDVFFLLRSGFADMVNATGDESDVNDYQQSSSATLSGLYQVTVVVNNFSGGMFTQELSGVRVIDFDYFEWSNKNETK